MVERPFQLRRWRVAAPPLINHFLRRLRLEPLLTARIPKAPGVTLGPVDCLLLLRNVLLAREPLYGLSGWSHRFHPDLLGLSDETLPLLNDDRVGRALEALFDADRASLIIEVVVQAVQEFGVALDRFHNGSTSLTLRGAYRKAAGATKRGKRTLRAARGHSKEHRPDLKQLLWIVSVSSDGAVPVHYRAEDGNTNDTPRHRGSWDALAALRGNATFLYVADSKLCDGDTLKYIDGKGGRFLTDLPRSRKEDRLFREHVQTHEVIWQVVRERPNPRNQARTRDVWKMAESPIPAADGFRLVWVWNSLMAEEDQEARAERVARAIAGLEDTEMRLQRPKTKMRTRVAVEKAAERAVGSAARWVGWRVWEEPVESFRQERRGRPGKGTRYVKTVKMRLDGLAIAHKKASPQRLSYRPAGGAKHSLSDRPPLIPVPGFTS